MVRAKLKDTYEWVFADNVSNICSYDIIPGTICREIGITDKNGKEIFEKDIIIVEDEEVIGWYIANKWVGIAFASHKHKQSDGVVAGNVFDNPDFVNMLEQRTKEGSHNE